jgi:hypothetical protein
MMVHAAQDRPSFQAIVVELQALLAALQNSQQQPPAAQQPPPAQQQLQ